MIALTEKVRSERDSLGGHGGLVARGVRLVTRGVRAGVMVALALPLTARFTLACMKYFGLPIRQMSVTGLIVALGLLVDAAIVMVDEVRKRLSQGMSREAAAGDAVRRLAAPLLASTVTTALAFTPMILLPGPAGDFVGSIASAVVLMLGWSVAVALTVTPAIAAWVLPARDAPKTPGLMGRGFEARQIMIAAPSRPKGGADEAGLPGSRVDFDVILEES